MQHGKTWKVVSTVENAATLLKAYNDEAFMIVTSSAVLEKDERAINSCFKLPVGDFEVSISADNSVGAFGERCSRSNGLMVFRVKANGVKVDQNVTGEIFGMSTSSFASVPSTPDNIVKAILYCAGKTQQVL